MMYVILGSAISDVMSKFSSTRSSLPSMVIVPPGDHTPWDTPSPPVFARLQLLARESLAILSTQTTGDVKVCYWYTYTHLKRSFRYGIYCICTV